jgi:hypothetical protein
MIIDEQATKEQRDALIAIESGLHSGLIFATSSFSGSGQTRPIYWLCRNWSRIILWYYNTHTNVLIHIRSYCGNAMVLLGIVLRTTLNQALGVAPRGPTWSAKVTMSCEPIVKHVSLKLSLIEMRNHLDSYMYKPWTVVINKVATAYDSAYNNHVKNLPKHVPMVRRWLAVIIEQIGLPSIVGYLGLDGS